MDKENQTIALERSHELVWSGFYSVDEIVESITETVFWSGELEADWLRNQVMGQFREKLAAEKSWPKVTDCDRLDKGLDSLRMQGIVVLQNAGYTQSDGIDDVAELYHEAGGELSDIKGYCFYHGQDLARVVATGELWLSFGDIIGTDQKGIEIGERIIKVLKSCDLNIEWDGSIETRLLVKGIRWQRRQKSVE